MYKIKTMNKIAQEGLSRFNPDFYTVSDTVADEDAIIVRSAKLHDYDFGANIKAIGRAGSGVNNIPLQACSEKGIAVFNTPGANANGVKELVLCCMLVGSRNLLGSAQWVKEQAASGIEVSTVVEKGKSAFVGPEIMNKKLGVIGLGAIGSMVANAAISLGMDVYGYDPYLSVEAALRLDRNVHVVKNLTDLYKKVDYITVHLHLTDATRGMINEEAIASMKCGVRIINLARGEVVNEDAMIAALESGKVASYVTDFPNNRIINAPHVVAFPHMGASTPESELNCAIMAANEVIDYLENGNIRNSVNLPSVSMERSGAMRLCIIHRNIPNMLASITSILSKDGANVENMSNKSMDDYAYTIVDLGSVVDEKAIDDVKNIDGVIRVRAII